jgi:hypothetical protein
MKTGTKMLTLAAAALAAAMAAPKMEASPEVSWGVAVGPVFVGGYRNPYRVIDGYRYYRHCPGPGYVRVTYGWGWRPHPRAIWVPPHYGPRGYRVDGSWR